MAHVKRSVPSSVVFTPAIRDVRELSDLTARVNWYLVDCPVDLSVEVAQSLHATPDAAPYMDANLVRSGLLHPIAKGTRRPPASETVVHRVDGRSLAAVLRSPRRSRLAAPGMHFFAEEGYRDLRQDLCPSNLPDASTSYARLARLRVSASAVVIGTGPSAAAVGDVGEYGNRIVCNSAVRDKSFLQQVQPTLIAFCDPVFHLGPSTYASAFRQDLLEAAEMFPDSLIATTRDWGDVLFAHLPMLKDRVVVLDSRDQVSWGWPQNGSMFAKSTGNVLTKIMLPLAFSLADRVAVAGCDGRKPSENYFWRHNQRTQYSQGLLNDVFTAHPSFFRDRNYADYYSDHCEELEQLCAEAERSGKTVRALTSSHIPAMRARGAAEPPD